MNTETTVPETFFDGPTFIEIINFISIIMALSHLEQGLHISFLVYLFYRYIGCYLAFCVTSLIMAILWIFLLRPIYELINDPPIRTS